MPKAALKNRFRQAAAFARIEQELLKGGQASVTGLSGGARSLLLATLIESRQEGLVVFTDTLEAAADLRTDLIALLEADTSDVLVLVPAGRSLYKHSSTEPGASADRAEALATSLATPRRTLIVPGRALLEKLPPPSRLSSVTWTLRPGDELAREALTERLEGMGYLRVDAVHEVGDYSVRGFIVDVYVPSLNHPLRIEYFGDELESLRLFDVTSQRSIGQLEEALICPAATLTLLGAERLRLAADIKRLAREQAETLRQQNRRAEATRLGEWAEAEADLIEAGRMLSGLERYTPLLFSQPASVLDYCTSSGKPVCVMGEELIADELENYFIDASADWQEACLQGRALGGLTFQLQEPEQALGKLTSQARLFLQGVVGTSQDSVTGFRLGTTAAPRFAGQLELFAQTVTGWQKDGKTALVLTPHPDKLRALLADRELDVTLASEQEQLRPGRLYVGRLDLAEGFFWEKEGLAVITESDLLGARRAPGRERRVRDVPKAASLAELKPGDYIVHISHGIGLYKGLVKRETDSGTRDYLEIEYSDGGKLFVSAQQMDRVQRYVGAGSEPPKVNSLEDVRWIATKRRARKQALEIADGLVRLYAEREQAEGFPFAADDAMQRELEARFPFVETDGQLKAVDGVKRDMQKPSPMDRLVCGDVGFGKTEVAVRAAFKAVLSNKQVAILVPTTVLAEQHYNTFRDRLAGFPARVEVMSRFRSRAQQQAVLRGLKAGAVDIVIGTHRLLSRDIEFKSLGLLIIDEEHRFGVLHKERLKELQAGVDVLTLTATPIPRTMQQALSGLVNLSTISDAPAGRLSVETFVEYETDEVIKDALQQELDRGGQVYLVTNTVRSAPFLAERIRKLAPTARVAVGHGQLAESELEEVMFEFYQGEYDVLVCTTIIESGLDIPNANTLLVHNADHFGLAQLYQLRGRVGRSTRQARAFFLVTQPKQLKHTAAQRLEAIQEHTQLGSGLNLAMRDLEIRGAGNLLGPQQHGFINSVGLELYLDMIKEAVDQLRTGKATAPVKRAVLELELDALIPEDYVQAPAQRLDLYRQISGSESVHDLQELGKALRDRYGPLPEQAKRLLEVAIFTLKAALVGIEAVRRTTTGAVCELALRANLKPKVVKLMNQIYMVRSSDLRASVTFQPHRIEVATLLSQEGLFRVLADIVGAMQHEDFKRLTSGGKAPRA